MSENNNQNMCNVCGSGDGRCGRCGNMCGFGKHHIIRWILGVLIITWVFCIGMEMGEVKAYLEQAGYGHGYRNARVMPMMGGYQDEVYFSQGVAVPTTAATGVKGGTVQVIKGN